MAVRAQSEDLLELIVDTRLYTEEAVFNASYWFTDRCYLFLERLDPDHVLVRFTQRDETTPLGTIAGEFANELINQRVRRTIADETRNIRDLIVAQAFAESGLLDSGGTSDDADTGSPRTP